MVLQAGVVPAKLAYRRSKRNRIDKYVAYSLLVAGILLCPISIFCKSLHSKTLTLPLSTQEYKWVPANCWGNLTNCWEVTCDGLASRPGRVEIFAAAATKTGISSGSYEPVLAPRLHFTVAAEVHSYNT